MIAKIYKKMYIRNLPFRVIVPICYQMRLNVVFSGLFDNKKKQTIRLKRAESPKALSPGQRPGYASNQQYAL